MKYLLAIIKKPRSRAFALIAWDECNDIVVQRLGWLKINASIYSRLILRAPDDPITEEWSLCEFKTRESYMKGRKLYSRHSDLSAYRSLVRPCDYEPLTPEEIQQILAEYTELKEKDRVKRSRFIYTVEDLAADWDIDKKQLYRYVNRGIKGSVTPSKRPNENSNLRRAGSRTRYYPTSALNLHED